MADQMDDAFAARTDEEKEILDAVFAERASKPP